MTRLCDQSRVFGELFERSLGNAENHFLFQPEVKINTFNARHVPNHTLSLVHLNTWGFFCFVFI